MSRTQKTAPVSNADDVHRAEEDRRARAQKVLVAGTASLKERNQFLDDIKLICFRDQCAAINANFQPERAFHILGRQSVWLEIQDLIQE